MWLTREVFPHLRTYVESLGFHLTILDPHPFPSCCSPTVQTLPYTQLLHQIWQDAVNLYLIIINKKVGWRLPESIKPKTFTSIQNRLKGNTATLDSVYRLDENALPPAYILIPSSDQSDELQRQQLYDELCEIATEEEERDLLNEGFHEEVTRALANHSTTLDNVIVLRRLILNTTQQKTYLDLDTNGALHDKLSKVFVEIIFLVICFDVL